MVICAARLRWRELSAAATLLAAFVLCLWGGRSQNAAAASALSAQAAGQDPAAYLSALGWELDGAPVTDYVSLPETFGPEYDDFLALQQAGGFDLTACAGAVVTRYTYTLTNYPTGEAGIVADVLVLDGRIVGGEIRSPAIDGFMEPLLGPEVVRSSASVGTPPVSSES